MSRLCVIASLAAVLAGCEPAEESANAQLGTGLRLLGGETGDGFARATEPREFVFPADHGTHPTYRSEWWYFTGNLATEGGRHFGFELTFFRYALARATPAPTNASAWRGNQVWMAHFAITDTQRGRFIARERLARGALGLAGAEAEPLRVWVADWSATSDSPRDLDLRLAARDDAVGLELDLVPTVPPVPQGDRGLDAKGAGVGNASYYYSVPRLAAEGRVMVDGEAFAVTGLAWLDREWSTSALEPGIAGWDWFALHLGDGSNLMLYRLRTENGGTSPFSGGTLVSSAGARTRLTAGDFSLTPLAHWTSPATSVRYPVAWRVSIAPASLTLDVTPYLENQEVALSVRYWEGAVGVQGRGPAGPLIGQGYLELAGY